MSQQSTSHRSKTRSHQRSSHKKHRAEVDAAAGGMDATSHEAAAAARPTAATAPTTTTPTAGHDRQSTQPPSAQMASSARATAPPPRIARPLPILPAAAAGAASGGVAEESSSLAACETASSSSAGSSTSTTTKPKKNKNKNKSKTNHTPSQGVEWHESTSPVPASPLPAPVPARSPPLLFAAARPIPSHSAALTAGASPSPIPSSPGMRAHAPSPFSLGAAMRPSQAHKASQPPHEEASSTHTPHSAATHAPSAPAAAAAIAPTERMRVKASRPAFSPPAPAAIEPHWVAPTPTQPALHSPHSSTSPPLSSVSRVKETAKARRRASQQQMQAQGNVQTTQTQAQPQPHQYPPQPTTARRPPTATTGGANKPREGWFAAGGGAAFSQAIHNMSLNATSGKHAPQPTHSNQPPHAANANGAAAPTNGAHTTRTPTLAETVALTSRAARQNGSGTSRITATAAGPASTASSPHVGPISDASSQSSQSASVDSPQTSANGRRVPTINKDSFQARAITNMLRMPSQTRGAGSKPPSAAPSPANSTPSTPLQAPVAPNATAAATRKQQSSQNTSQTPAHPHPNGRSLLHPPPSQTIHPSAPAPTSHSRPAIAPHALSNVKQAVQQNQQKQQQQQKQPKNQQHQPAQQQHQQQQQQKQPAPHSHQSHPPARPSPQLPPPFLAARAPSISSPPSRHGSPSDLSPSTSEYSSSTPQVDSSRSPVQKACTQSAPASPTQGHALMQASLSDKMQREQARRRETDAMRDAIFDSSMEDETDGNATASRPFTLTRPSSSPHFGPLHRSSSPPAMDRGLPQARSLNASFDRRRAQDDTILHRPLDADDAEEEDDDGEEEEEAEPSEDDFLGVDARASSHEDQSPSPSHARAVVDDTTDDIESVVESDADTQHDSSYLASGSDDQRVTRSADVSPSDNDTDIEDDERGRRTTLHGMRNGGTRQSPNPVYASAPPLNMPLSNHHSPASFPVHSPPPTFSNLHIEIQNISTMINPKLHDARLRRDVAKRVSCKVWELWPDAEVHIIGSCATNLFLEDSDIDLVIRNSVGRPKLGMHDLYVLGEHLAPMGSHINIISTAAVPLIKLVDKQTNYTVDLTLNVETGLYSTTFVIEQLDRYPDVLHRLTIVLKQFLKAKGLNDLYSGGLPSYTLILMIVSFLQNHPPEQQRQRAMHAAAEEEKQATPHADVTAHVPLRTQLQKSALGEATNLTSPITSPDAALSPASGPCTPGVRASPPVDLPPVDLGEYLLAFLRLYSLTFAYETYGISLRTGYFLKASRGWLHPHNPFLLCLENPMDATIDLGFKVFNYAAIRSAFLEAYELLKVGKPAGFGQHAAHMHYQRESNDVRRHPGGGNDATTGGGYGMAAAHGHAPPMPVFPPATGSAGHSPYLVHPAPVAAVPHLAMHQLGHMHTAATPHAAYTPGPYAAAASSPNFDAETAPHHQPLLPYPHSQSQAAQQPPPPSAATYPNGYHGPHAASVPPAASQPYLKSSHPPRANGKQPPLPHKPHSHKAQHAQ